MGAFLHLFGEWRRKRAELCRGSDSECSAPEASLSSCLALAAVSTGIGEWAWWIDYWADWHSLSYWLPCMFYGCSEVLLLNPSVPTGFHSRYTVAAIINHPGSPGRQNNGPGLLSMILFALLVPAETSQVALLVPGMP